MDALEARSSRTFAIALALSLSVVALIATVRRTEHHRHRAVAMCGCAQRGAAFVHTEWTFVNPDGAVIRVDRGGYRAAPTRRANSLVLGLVTDDLVPNMERVAAGNGFDLDDLGDLARDNAADTQVWQLR